MKNLALITAIVLLTTYSAEAEPVNDGPIVRPLTRETAEGCWLYFTKARYEDPPIFYRGGLGAFINVDGQELELTQTSESEKYDSVEYKAGEYTVLIKYGHGMQSEVGVTFKNATLTVSKQGKTRIIKAKGGCGC